MPQRTFSQGSDHERVNMQLFLVMSCIQLFSALLLFACVCRSCSVFAHCWCACIPLFKLLIVKLGGDRGSNAFNTLVAALTFQTKGIERNPVMWQSPSLDFHTQTLCYYLYYDNHKKNVLSRQIKLNYCVLLFPVLDISFYSYWRKTVEKEGKKKTPTVTVHLVWIARRSSSSGWSLKQHIQHIGLFVNLQLRSQNLRKNPQCRSLWRENTSNCASRANNSGKWNFISLSKWASLRLLRKRLWPKRLPWPPTMLSGKRAQTTKKSLKKTKNKKLSANRVATGSTDGSTDVGAYSLCGHQQRLVQSDPLTHMGPLQISFAWQAASAACLHTRTSRHENICRSQTILQTKLP